MKQFCILKRGDFLMAGRKKKKKQDVSNRAMVYRIYPTAEQKVFLAKTFGCCRKVWNLMLGDKINHYKEHKEMLDVSPAMYKKEYDYLKEVDSLALANVQQHLNEAYQRFFKKKARFPKFKKKGICKDSYTTNNQKGTVALLDDSVRLPKIGRIKADIHRRPPEDWLIKTATITRQKDGTYQVSLMFEYKKIPVPVRPVTGTNVIGLDYKSDGLYVADTGETADMPHFYRKSAGRLARLQRRLSRTQPDSNRHEKARLRVAKLQRHVANQRKDYLQKKSAEIANQYDYVCVEDLDMRAMSNKGFGIGKATLDNGFGMFRNMLSYKLEQKGGCLIKVDRFFPSSQLCSCCGNRNPEVKDLSIRKWTCSVCATVHDRDINAAKNIKKEGLRLLFS